MRTNPVTGEVTFEIGGTEFVLHAGSKRLADFQSAIMVPGLVPMIEMIASRDARAIYYGLRHLCKSGNAAKLDEMNLLSHYDVICDALVAALAVTLPERAADSENPQTATATIN